VIRDTWADTAAAFASRAMRRLQKTAHRGEEDWQHPAGDDQLPHPHDDAQERSRYLREVTDPALPTESD
jgi:hypothetical protein